LEPRGAGGVRAAAQALGRRSAELLPEQRAEIESMTDSHNFNSFNVCIN
jgi:hypothetical protein